MSASALGLIRFTVGGLTPGDQVDAYFDCKFDAPATGHSGASESGFVVADDGTVEFDVPTHQLTRGHPGSVRCWAVPAGDPSTEPPATTADGPAETTIHVP